MQLKEYLNIHNVQPRRFCRAAGISENTLHGILKKGRSMHVGTAYAIEQASNGFVTMQDIAKELLERENKKKKDI